VSPYRIASFVIIAATLVAATSARARAAEANPFAHADVVWLFSRLPGTVAAPHFAGEPQPYESKRLDIYGVPDPSQTKTGRLNDGSWILISEIGGAWLVYRWSAGSATVIGVLHPQLDSETVGIEDGAIVDRARVYSPVGPCAPGSLLIRRFAIRSGVLHEVERETDPPHFATTLAQPLPNRKLDDETFIQALADRTPGLYRMCDHGHNDVEYGNGTSRYYHGENIDVYGFPMAEGSVRFSSGSARLIAVPFGSGGNGGAFTGAVYRIDLPHPVLVRTLRSNTGHLWLRAHDGILEMFSPAYGGPRDDEAFSSRYDVRSFRYDARTHGLITIDMKRYAVATFQPSTNSYRSLAIANNAGFPFDGTDVDALIERLPGTTIERAAGGGDDFYYSSKRYGFYGRPNPDATTSGILADGTRVLLVPFDSGFDVMIFRRIANHTIPIDSLVGPHDVSETVTVERGAIVQRSETETSAATTIPKRVTVTYALRDGRLVETSRLETAPVRPTSSPIASP